MTDGSDGHSDIFGGQAPRHLALHGMLKRLVNRTEERVGERLRWACEQHSARVYAKVRIADVCEITNSGVADAEYSFALRAHFDFVVADADHMPLFVVEFDGPSHDSPAQHERDCVKERLCEHFSVPLLRCRSAHLDHIIDGWDLLSWLVDVWFMRESANHMQSEGLLPPDFDFDPASVMSAPGHARRFPYWLGLDAQLELRRLHKLGRVADATPWVLYQGLDSQDVRRGFACWRIDAACGIRVTAAMRAQHFAADFGQAMDGILMNALRAELGEVLAGKREAVPLVEIDVELQELRRRTALLSCFR
jgi:hypothetical protein